MESVTLEKVYSELISLKQEVEEIKTMLLPEEELSTEEKKLVRESLEEESKEELKKFSEL